LESRQLLFQQEKEWGGILHCSIRRVAKHSVAGFGRHALHLDAGLSAERVAFELIR